MPSVSESIVRDWLELHGCLVRQPRKYQVVARAKRPDEEIDLLAWNPAAEGTSPPPGLWDGRSLRAVRAAAVSVRGWFTERFAPATFEDNPDLMRIGSPEVRREAARRLGVESVATILCLPSLPPASDLARRTLEMLREHGVDGVVLFRIVLTELASAAGRRFDYDRSDVLQMLRICRSLGLLRDPQLELFRGRARSGLGGTRRRKANPAADGGGDGQ